MDNELTGDGAASAFLAAIVESSHDAIVGKSLDGKILSWNAAAEQLFGYRSEEMVGRSIRALIPENLQGEEDRILSQIIMGARVEPFETVRLHKAGHELHLSVSVSPVRDKAGKVIAASKIARDLRPELRLRAQIVEARQLFDLLAENISQLAWIADGTGMIFWYNKRWFDYTGTTLEQMKGWGWMAVHHPDHVRRVVERITHSWTTGEPWEDTFPLRGANGTFRWFLSRAMPIRDGSGKIEYWFGTNTDITDLRSAEKRNALLLRELGHRSKNMMTLIQSVARITADREEYRTSLEARIAGMAACQDLLMRTDWVSVPIGEMIKAQLQFLTSREQRVGYHGPDIEILASAAERLGMAMHELATNAVKYGALSTRCGSVEITWRISDAGTSSIFEIQWLERGGPPVSRPVTVGFGSQLISDIPRADLSADVSIDYTRDGICWRLSAPASIIISPSETGHDTLDMQLYSGGTRDLASFIESDRKSSVSSA